MSAKPKYDMFMPEYELIRSRNEILTEEKRQRIYKEIPELKVWNDDMADSTIGYAKARLMGRSDHPIESLDDYMKDMLEERDRLLAEHGYSPDVFEPVYTCKLCKDTGFIGGEPCACLKQRIIDYFYKQSLIKRSLEVENFENFDISFYSDKEFGSYLKTPRKQMEENLEKAKDFVESFDKKSSNLLLRGSSGLGKTYLSNCIAKSVLDKGKTVLYLSSTRLFDEIIPDVMMNKNIHFENADIYDYVYSCELLIIDDFGTEQITKITLPNIFQCINERLVAGLSTVISTNLTLEDIRNTYSERIFSRLIDRYEVLEFYGENIRYKRLSEG